MPPRLIAGLLYLQHANDASDEAVVNMWLENPYWQYFIGETYLQQTELPIDPSSLTRWRQRIGEEDVEVLLAVTIEAASAAGLINKASVQRVIMNNTVVPKAVAHPIDSRLVDSSRQHLVKAAQAHELKLRQNYNRIATGLAAQIGHYAHVKHFKRMRRAVRTLRSRVDRMHRDVQRQLDSLPAKAQADVQNLLQRTGRILAQRTKNKLQDLEGHDQAQKCDRAGHRAHEDGWAPGPQPAQGPAWRCHPCRDVRRWAQTAPDPGRAEALLRPKLGLH